MRILLILIISFCPMISLFAQEYPDTGFTNKAEAKNLMVNGLKEGKWVENVNWQWDATSDTTSRFYRLVTYKQDTIKGLVRIYWNDGTFCFAIPYANGKKNGIGRGLLSYGSSDSIVTPFKDDKINGNVKSYENGKLHIETPFTDGKANGVEKRYYENGKLQRETTYVNGIVSSIKNFDENGNEIK